jgi:hypothetical protein
MGLRRDSETKCRILKPKNAVVWRLRDGRKSKQNFRTSYVLFWYQRHCPFVYEFIGNCQPTVLSRFMEHFLHWLCLKTVNLWPNKWNLRLITQQSVTNYCDYEILNYLVIWSLYDIFNLPESKNLLKRVSFWITWRRRERTMWQRYWKIFRNDTLKRFYEVRKPIVLWMWPHILNGSDSSLYVLFYIITVTVSVDLTLCITLNTAALCFSCNDGILLSRTKVIPLLRKVADKIVELVA